MHIKFNVIARLFISGLLALPFVFGCSEDDIDKSCEYQGMTYEDGEEFSVDSCNSCKCNPSGTGPGASLGVGCSQIACPQVCSGTLGTCELNSHSDCPEEFPRENSECTIDESATCYKCGFSELDAVAESAYCESGQWKVGEIACSES